MSKEQITERTRKADKKFMTELRNLVERKSVFPSNLDMVGVKKLALKYLEKGQIDRKAFNRFIDIYDTWVLPTGSNSYNKKVVENHPLTKAGYRYDRASKSLVKEKGRDKSIREAKSAIREIGTLAKRLKLRKPKMSQMEKRMRRNLEREELGLPPVEDPREFIKRMTRKGQRKRQRGEKPKLIQKLEDEKTIRDLLEEYDKDIAELEEELK